MSTPSNELTVLQPGEGPDLEATKRADAPAIWQSFATRRDELLKVSAAIVVTDASQKAQIVLARTTRLQIKALRCEIENKRQELVEGFNKATGQINTTARAFREQLNEEEGRLIELEQFAEREEVKRKEALRQERAEMLAQIEANPAHYQLDNLSEEEFTALYNRLETDFLAKQEADAKAEAERKAKAKADAEDRERLRMENERLRQEAAQREAAALKERIAAEVDRQAADLKASVERAAIEEKARQESAAAGAAALKERQAREAAEAELKRTQENAARAERARIATARAEQEAKEAIARQEQADKEEAARKAAAAPDKEKLLAFAATVRALAIPDFATADVQKWSEELTRQVANLADWVERKASVL